MAATIVEELAMLVQAKVDKASFMRGKAAFEEMERKGKAAAKSAGGLGEAVSGLFAGGTLLAMGAFVKGQINVASALDDTSKRLGVTVEDLQRLTYAAEQSGASADAAANGLKFLQKNASEAASGSGAAADAFRSLGVSVKDANGNIRPTTDIMADVADGFVKLPEGAQRTAAAMAVFGRAGVDLVPLLAGGAQGVRELALEAEDLGIVFSQELVTAGDDAGDELLRLRKSFDGLKMNIAAQFFPVIQRASETLRRWIKTTREVVSSTGAMRLIFAGAAVGGALAFGKLATSALKAANILNVTKKGLGGVAQGLGQIGSKLLWPLALALILEDVYTWLKGGDSLIGDFFTKFLGAEKAAELAGSLREAFSTFGTTLDNLKPVLTEILGGLARLAADIAPTLAKALGVVVNVVAALVNGLSTVVRVLGAVFSGKSGGEIGKIFDEQGARILKNLSDAAGSFSSTPALPAPPPAGVADQGPKLEQTNTINITGVQDPARVAQAVGGAVGSVNADALAAMGR